MALSFAAAIALIEIICALLPLPAPVPALRERVVRMALTPILLRASPAPPRVRERRIVRRPQSQLRTRRVRPKASHRARVARKLRHRQNVLAATSNRPPWESAIVASSHAGHGAGTGVQGGGTGGSPAGNAPAGGAQVSAAPCGAVDFVSMPAAAPDAASGLYVYDGITMIVHFPDGHAERVTLDWPWHYRNPAMDPFKHDDAPLFFQFPPEAVRASEPPLVQYVMAHTTPEGSTELDPCVSEPPLPARTPPP